MFEQSLIEDKFTLGSAIVLISLIILISIIFPWMSINVQGQETQSLATWYWTLGLTGLIITSVGMVLGKVYKNFDLDVPLWSRKTAFGKMNNLHVLIFLLGMITLSLFVIVNTAGKTQMMIYGSPQFQAIKLSQAGEALLSGLVGIIEELGIIAIGVSIIYFSSYKMSGDNGIIAFLITMFSVPLLFGVYHWAVYGTDTVALTTVIFMGLISTSMILILRNFLVGVTFHFSNNFALAYFAGAGLSPAVVIMDFGLFYGIAYGLVILWWFFKGRYGD